MNGRRRVTGRKPSQDTAKSEMMRKANGMRSFITMSTVSSSRASRMCQVRADAQQLRDAHGGQGIAARGEGRSSSASGEGQDISFRRVTRALDVEGSTGAGIRPVDAPHQDGVPVVPPVRGREVHSSLPLVVADRLDVEEVSSRPELHHFSNGDSFLAIAVVRLRKRMPWRREGLQLLRVFEEKARRGERRARAVQVRGDVLVPGFFAASATKR